MMIIIILLDKNKNNKNKKNNNNHITITNHNNNTFVTSCGREDPGCNYTWSIFHLNPPNLSRVTIKIYQSRSMYSSRVAINRFHLKLFLTSTLCVIIGSDQIEYSWRSPEGENTGVCSLSICFSSRRSVSDSPTNVLRLNPPRTDDGSTVVVSPSLFS